MSERWVGARGFAERYEVSSCGNVRRIKPRSDRTGVIRQPVTKGYHVARLAPDGLAGRKVKMISVRTHRLVWESFNSPIPEGMQINHKNGVKTDNRLENLEVCTPSENTLHGFRVLGRKPSINPNPGSRNGRSRLSEKDIPQIRRMISKGKSDIQIAAKYGVNPATIWWIRKGKTWAHIPTAD